MRQRDIFFDLLSLIYVVEESPIQAREKGMADNFMLVILPIVAMPWRYFFKKYIVDRRAA